MTHRRNEMLVKAMANPEQEIDSRETGPKTKVKATQACANAQYELDQFRENAAALAVGLATFLAALGAGFSGFLLLRMVGMTDTPI